jgi:hypothetical protein
MHYTLGCYSVGVQATVCSPLEGELQPGSVRGFFIAQSLNRVTFIKLRQHGPRLWTAKKFSPTEIDKMERLSNHGVIQPHNGNCTGEGFDEHSGTISAACA